MSAESTFKKTEVILIGVLALLAMILVTVAVIPSLRLKAKQVFTSSSREVLAKVSGKISPEGPQVTVLKIKSGDNLSLEVYSLENDEMTLISKIPLFENRDGHVLLQGNATNLALMDLDKDGKQEIVAPTYDDQMIPRLNIFKYNSGSHSFDRATAPDNFEFK